MCRSRSIMIAMLSAAMLAGSPVSGQERIEDILPPAVEPDESVQAITDWLERHGAQELLARHLEEQIDTATGQQLRTLILRLANIYAELLERVNDPAHRELLEVRAKRLLTIADDDGSEELRLALLRTSYRTAENIAEQHRLRLATEVDLARARSILKEVVPQLQELYHHVEQNVNQMERQLTRASGTAIATLSSRADRLALLFQQTGFLTAWALYHDAWLNDNEVSAREAEDAFAKLLLTDSPRPQPEDVSHDLRSAEPFARSILGMALSRSRTASAGTALRWIDLLEHENTYPPLRQQAMVWRLVIHLEHQEYPQINTLLRPLQQAGDMLPAMWLRLLAVHALEAPPGVRGADELVRFTISQLAAQSELDQILDLAERFGVEGLGDSGFALRYVNGLLAYREARDAHQEEVPATDTAHRAMYGRAVQHLSDALAEHDADQFSTALGACNRLMGWALYFQGRFRAAKDAFLAAEMQLNGDEAAEAMWMAIVSMDELQKSTQSQEVKVQQDELIEQFISKYPGSTRIPSLLLRQALASARLDEQTLTQLLAIQPDHSSYEIAMRRAAQELYQRFREAPREEKADIAAMYLELATMLVDRATGDDVLLDRLVLDLRRILEVSLNADVQRVILAQRALQQYETLVEGGKIDGRQLAVEMTYRRLQERLIDGDLSTAADMAEQLWEHDDESPWARIASRAMFQHAYELRPLDDATRLQLIARFGGRVIREYEDKDNALQSSQVLGYHATVADAMRQLWMQDGDSQFARAALFLYQRLLQVEPRNGEFLRAAATLATHLQEFEFAADCWRRISAGTPADTMAWYEARFELISVLASLDPQRGREVMSQHIYLYPEYGPPPWGERLRNLASELGLGEGGS